MNKCVDKIMEERGEESPLRLVDLMDIDSQGPKIIDKQTFLGPVSSSPEVQRRNLHIAQIASGTATALLQATKGRGKPNITRKQTKTLSQIAVHMCLPLELTPCEYKVFSHQVTIKMYKIAMELGVPLHIIHPFSEAFEVRVEGALIAWDEHLVKVAERKEKTLEAAKEKKKKEEWRDTVREKFAGAY